MPSLIYTGQGFRPDLPARDVDASELTAIANDRKIAVADLVEAARSSGLYQIVTEPDDEVTAAAEPKSLDEMSRAELRAACKDIGISQAGSMAEMIARIRETLFETTPEQRSDAIEADLYGTDDDAEAVPA